MLENPTPAATAPPPDSTTVKRYAPPNQRNRSLNRRKSGDRFDRGNSLYQNDGEKNQQPQSHANTRNNIPDHHGDAGSSSLLNDNSSPHTLIPLEGCCRSEASQLLNDRWAAIMHSYNDTAIDLSGEWVVLAFWCCVFHCLCKSCIFYVILFMLSSLTGRVLIKWCLFWL